MRKLLCGTLALLSMNVSAQVHKKQRTEESAKADSMSANLKPATSPAGGLLQDTASGYHKWEEHRTDSSNFRPLKSYNKNNTP